MFVRNAGIQLQTYSTEESRRRPPYPAFLQALVLFSPERESCYFYAVFQGVFLVVSPALLFM
jgi:hypothetical protein